MKRYANNYVELETVVNAELAIQAVNKKKYRIIFMDINLKVGMDGKQAAKIIRTLNGYEKTPIVATTAYAMLNDKEEFLSAGCSHYLSKPFFKDELISLIRKLLPEID